MKKKIMIVSTTAIALVLAGGLYISGTCPGPCSLFSVSDAIACGGGAKSTSADAAGCGGAKAIQANAEGKTCTKEQCVSWLMANKGMSLEEAEAAYANCSKSCSEAKAGVMKASATGSSCASKATQANATGSSCASKAKATQANATGSSCASKAKATQANATGSSCGSKAKATQADATGSSCSGKAMKANATGSSCSSKAKTIQADASGKSCTKEQCVSWLMANKSMTREQAEAAFSNCAESKAAAEKAVMTASAGPSDPTTDKAAVTTPDGADN